MITHFDSIYQRSPALGATTHHRPLLAPTLRLPPLAEPLSLSDPPRGSAGPINARSLGWPLETLGERIVMQQHQRNPVYTGQTRLPGAQFEAALNAKNKVSREQRTVSSEPRAQQKHRSRF